MIYSQMMDDTSVMVKYKYELHCVSNTNTYLTPSLLPTLGGRIQLQPLSSFPCQSPLILYRPPQSISAAASWYSAVATPSRHIMAAYFDVVDKTTRTRHFIQATIHDHVNVIECPCFRHLFLDCLCCRENGRTKNVCWSSRLGASHIVTVIWWTTWGRWCHIPSLVGKAMNLI